MELPGHYVDRLLELSRHDPLMTIRIDFLLRKLSKYSEGSPEATEITEELDNLALHLAGREGAPSSNLSGEPEAEIEADPLGEIDAFGMEEEEDDVGWVTVISDEPQASESIIDKLMAAQQQESTDAQSESVPSSAPHHEEMDDDTSSAYTIAVHADQLEAQHDQLTHFTQNLGQSIARSLQSSVGWAFNHQDSTGNDSSQHAQRDQSDSDDRQT